MRVLFTCVGAKGRFHPLVELARAVVRRGHDVRVATSADFCAEIAAAGLEPLPSGLGIAELRAAGSAVVPGADALPPDAQAELMFVRLAPQAMCEALLAHCTRWRPDVVLHEEGEYGAPLAARLIGVPSVVVGWPSPMRSPAVIARLGAALAELWERFGLAGADAPGIYDTLFLDPCPPRFQAPYAWRVGAPRRSFRPALATPDAAVHSPPIRWEDDGRPVVHATLGTVDLFSRAPELFAAIASGLADEDVRLVMTVGDAVDAAALAERYPNAEVARYIPHRELIGRCAVVICHGGCGTTVAALAHGIPLLVIPRGGAVQQRNALACVRSGVGLAIGSAEDWPGAIRSSVRTLLRDPGYAARCRAIAGEIWAMPDPDEVIPGIERLSA